MSLLLFYIRVKANFRVEQIVCSFMKYFLPRLGGIYLVRTGEEKIYNFAPDQNTDSEADFLQT